MRILHVIGSLNPASGGPPEAVKQMARVWLEIGESPEIVCLDTPDAPFLADVCCPVHALGPSRGRFGYSLRLRKWLEQNVSHFSFLVMEGLWTYPSLAVRSAARAAGKPWGIFVHGGLDPWFNRAYPLKRLKKSLYWPLQYPALRDASAVFFTTGIERDLARTSFRPSRWNSVVVPFGVKEPQGDPCKQIAAFHESFPSLKDRRFLLFLGRLHAKKGCDLLISSFCRAASTYPHLNLMVAGPDQDGLRAALAQVVRQAGLESRVHWIDMLSGPAKWGALRVADALILPSHQENFGMVVAESLAAGRPVLISNQVNIWQEIQEEDVGLVEDDTLEGTDRLIRNWMTLDADRQNEMAGKALGCFRRRFSLDATAIAVRQTLTGDTGERR